MNLVGKIFVGIIALMSVVCLTVSALSYSSHHNWKEKSADLKKQLDDAKQQQQTLTSQKTELENKLQSEIQSYTAAIESLKTHSDLLVQENADLKQTNEDLQKDLDNRLAVIDSNNTHIDDLRQQLSATSNDLASAQQLRANYLQDLARTMEKLHELSAKYGDLEERTTILQSPTTTRSQSEQIRYFS